jgi:ribonuclease E
MLINATQPEEVRVALVDGQRLYDLDIESRAREQKKASIYKARITRVEPSLEAAFVDFGADRHGFLPLKEVARSYFRNGDEGGKKAIQDLIHEGQEVIVQVEKEERGNKGAALSTFVSLAGRYLVLMPNNPRAGGISRRIEGDERDMLRDALSKLNIPEGMGVIIRTAGIGRTPEEMQSDLDYLVQLWEAIQKAADEGKAPLLLYQENNIILRAIRDSLRADIGEVLVDERTSFEEARSFIEQVMPSYRDRIKHYSDTIPLFSRYQIESQIESAFDRQVKLPSGGSIVIDPTEALVSIDINSARATKGADIEETALNTNLEAAEEVARQLRLRDVGGLIVIDFIDMSSAKNQRAVETRMREVLEADRARVQVGRISRFGLLEMSRQRLRPSLEEITTEICPRCSGQGRVRDIRSLSLAILRVMEEEAMKDRSSIVRAIVPIAVGSYLLNEKRRDVAEIERRTGTHLVIAPSANLETPNYEVQRIRDDLAAAEADVASYELAEAAAPEEALPARAPQRFVKSQEAVVRPTPPPPPAPTPEAAPAASALVAAPAAATPEAAAPGAPAGRGLFRRIIDGLFGGTTETPAATAAAPPPAPPVAEPAPARTSREGEPTREGQRARGGRGRGRGRDRDRDRERPTEAGAAERGRARDAERGGERPGERGERNGDRGRDRDRPRRAERRDEGRTERREEGRTENRDESRAEPRSEARPERPGRPEREDRVRERGGRGRRERAREEMPEEGEAPAITRETVAAREATLPEEARTRGIEADRTPREDERGKRKPRRDRSEIARSADASARERTPIGALPVMEAQPNAEVLDVAPSTAELFPERSEAPVERASNDPRNPRRVSFDDVGPSQAVETPAVDTGPRVAEPPEPPRVSPAVAAAAQVVELPPPPPPREQPVGRAYNDPREVRRREREAQLRREGEVIRPEGNG